MYIYYITISNPYINQGESFAFFLFLLFGPTLDFLTRQFYSLSPTTNRSLHIYININGSLTTFYSFDGSRISLFLKSKFLSLTTPCKLYVTIKEFLLFLFTYTYMFTSQPIFKMLKVISFSI